MRRAISTSVLFGTLSRLLEKSARGSAPKIIKLAPTPLLLRGNTHSAI